jgi:hypothetical protein
MYIIDYFFKKDEPTKETTTTTTTTTKSTVQLDEQLKESKKGDYIVIQNKETFNDRQGTFNKIKTFKEGFVYLVINKATQAPLGVFDTLEKAKKEGQIATYHNCSILKLEINDRCKYLINPIFENK